MATGATKSDQANFGNLFADGPLSLGLVHPQSVTTPLSDSTVPGPKAPTQAEFIRCIGPNGQGIGLSLGADFEACRLTNHVANRMKSEIPQRNSFPEPEQQLRESTSPQFLLDNLFPAKLRSPF